jgi:bifunctional non-homologous end joining protein LigD
LDDTKHTGAIRYSEHFVDNGSDVWDQACRMNLEGIVSKRASAPYKPGRSDSFIKIKCANAQELVVGGYAPSTVTPKAVGALATGYYRDGKLIYAGRVGTGYSRATARDLWKRLHPLETAKTPFDEIPRAEARSRDLRWVAPTTVIESQFRGWTTDGMVRQAAFKGLREDKPATEVARETPVAERVRPRAVAASAKPAVSKSREEVRFTHPGRVYWPDAGVTKQRLADYYRSVWTWMAPHVVNAPLSLLRCPDGIQGECFFQKHASAGLDDQKLRSVIDGKGRQVVAVEDLDGLLTLVQAGVLEVHVRGSLIDSLDLCRRIVFDIDPGDGVPWTGIVKAARDVRDRLAAIDLDCFVKLSGGKGLHVVLPVAPVEWETVKMFTQAFAQAMAIDDPKRYIAKMTKSLRKGKVFIDYLRNSLEQTSVAAYSTRARDGAPVSMPVSWDELGRVKSSSQFTVLNVSKRLGSLARNPRSDPWADIGRVKQKLPNLATLRKRI